MVPGYSARGALRDAVAKGFADRLKSPIARGHLFAELERQGNGKLGRGFAAGVFIGLWADKAVDCDRCSDGIDAKPFVDPVKLGCRHTAIGDALEQTAAVAALDDPLIDKLTETDALPVHLVPDQIGVLGLQLVTALALVWVRPLTHPCLRQFSLCNCMM